MVTTLHKPCSFSQKDTEQSVAARFEDIVRQYPLQVAVESPTESLTYEQFNQRANQLARAILDISGTHEELVAVLLEQGVAFLVSIFGVFKAGKAYVPLDPTFPAQRNIPILESSTAKVLITNNQNLELAMSFVPQGCQILNIDHLNHEISSENLDLEISPDTLAYIIYTSGSTGKPKGVYQNQRNLLFNCMNQVNAFNLGPGDRMTLLHSCSVMGAVRVIYNALLSGTSLYPFDVKADGLGKLRDWLKQKQITVYHSVATLFRHFAGILTPEDRFPDLRLLILGGEASTRKDFDLYRKHLPDHCKFVTGLGATETGTVCVRLLGKTDKITNSLLAPGYVVPGMEVMLLDDNGKEVQTPEVGEIVVKSRYLALGYWGRPDLTAKAFSDIPTGNGERLYRMGDLGKFEPDGCLVHVGRKDFQVKVRGFRVELSEIESALLDTDWLKETVVVGRQDAEGETFLTAYYVPKDNSNVDATTLRRFLRRKLPSYMLPATFVKLDALPLTANGKINRLVLPAPDLTNTESSGDLVEPRTEWEQTLATVWARLFNISRVSVTDNFFDLGGNSLLAARMTADLEAILAPTVSVAMVMQAPTIEKLAIAIHENRTASSILEIQPEGDKNPFFFINSVGETRNLAPYFAKHGIPLYGLNIFGLTTIFSDRFNEVTIEAIAERFVADIKSVKPQGPYQLMTFCGDSYLTWEIAQQLQKQGEEVACMCLIDGLLQPYEPSVKHRFQSFQTMGFGYAIRKLKNTMLASVKRQIKMSIKQLRNHKLAKLKKSADPLAVKVNKDREFYQVYEAVKRDYDLKPYSGTVYLLLSEEWKFCDRSQLEYLCTGQVKTLMVKGLHFDLFKEPALSHLTAVLGDILV